MRELAIMGSHVRTNLLLLMLVPPRPKIYHIVHVDRLESIIADGYLWSDAEVRKREIDWERLLG